MAETQEVQIKISADTSGATKSVGSIKSQLKDANQELISMREQFGETSNEAIQAAKRVANLKDEIGDAKALTDAFNPDAKFKAFGSAIQGVVGGFAALQGAQALFGSESKELEETLVKVQGALALSQGLNSVLEAKDAFKNLGAVMKTIPLFQRAITAAQFLWNAATAANPIGALVTAIVALIAAGALLIKFFQDSSKEAKRNEESVKANKKALDEQSKTLEKNAEALETNQKYKLELAKANGASTKQIRELELKLIDEKIAFANASRETAKNTFEKNKNALATLKAAGASDEVIEKQKELTNESYKEFGKQTQDLNNSYKQKADIIRKQNVEIITEQRKANEDATKLAEENRKKAAEKAKENEDEIKKNNEELQNRLLDIKNQYAEDSLKNDDERAKKKIANDLKNEIAEVNKLKASDELKKKVIAELQAKAKIQIDAIDEKTRKDKEAKQVEFDNELAALTLQTRLAGIKDVREKERVTLDEDFFQKRQQVLNNEKTTSEEKKLLIAQLLIQEQISKNELESKFAQEDSDKKIAKLEKQIQDQTLAKEVRLQAITDEQALLDQQFANKLISEEEYNKSLKKLSDDRVNIDIAEKEAKAQIIGQIGDIAVGLVNLLKSSNEKSKGLAIASLIVEQAASVAKIIANTAVANAKSVAASPLTAGQPFVAINTISAGLSIASSIAAVIKGINQIKSASPSGGGGGGSAPSVGGGGGGSVAPPLQPQLGSTLINQAQVNEIGSAASRAYVVESDVSGNQERIQRINRAARIG